MTELYNRIIEQADIRKIDKLAELNDPETFWDDVRKLTRRVNSDHSIRRWECLAECRFAEIAKCAR